MTEPRLWGLIAIFSTPDGLKEAALLARATGYTELDALTPYPVEDLDSVLRIRAHGVARYAFAGGLTGAITGFFMQQYSAVIHYPLNIGGRPLFSWPAFVPLIFELTVLFAGFSAVISMLVKNRLPNLHHPLFGAKHIERASLDRFFLCIAASDPKFDRTKTWEFLESLAPELIEEVPE